MTRTSTRIAHSKAFSRTIRYPEVRSANTDDPTVPVSTTRSWTLGIFWAIIIPVLSNHKIYFGGTVLIDSQSLNQFFFFRYPSIQLTGIVAQLLTYPMGRARASPFPIVSILGVSLNPGPFSVLHPHMPRISLPYNGSSIIRHTSQLPMDDSDVNPAHRVLSRWYHSSVPRTASFNDLAR